MRRTRLAGHWRMLVVAAVAVVLLSASVFGAVSAGAAKRPLIQGGTEAKEGQFPWMAWIEYGNWETGEPETSGCSGTVVSPTVILTAGHCVKEPKEGGGATLAAGKYHVVTSAVKALIDGDKLCTACTRSAVSRVIPYPGFSYGGGAVIESGRDAGLLVLSKPIAAPSIQLDQVPGRQNPLVVGSEAFVAGYGITSPAGNTAGTLYSTTTKIESLAPECEAFSVCIGNVSQKGTCEGDSGGPLWQEAGYGPVELGLTSRGPSNACNQTIDTRVDEMRPWIEEQIAAAKPAVAYVANFGSSSVTPLEFPAGSAGSEVKVGSPEGVAITPNGKTAYVTDALTGTVLPVEVATNKAGSEIGVGESPRGIAVTPNGQTAYVANYKSNSVTPIELATGKAGSEIKVGSHPEGVAITPNGKTVYVTNEGSDSVTPIEVATNKALTEIEVGHQPYGVAVTPNGNTAYVTNGEGDSVTPIELATGKAGLEIKVGKTPRGIAIAPSGKTAYVANAGSNSVTPIEVATNTAGSEVTVGGNPVGVAFGPSGATAYVTNETSGSVTPIEVATNTPDAEIKVGKDPVAVALASVPELPAVATAAASEITDGSATVGATVDPDGSEVTACTVEYGTTNAYGTSAPCNVSPGSGEGPVEVSAALEGLAPSTEYHYRISATNAAGTSVGSDKTFKTGVLAPAPTVVTGAASAITNTAATLNATVRPRRRGGEQVQLRIRHLRSLRVECELRNCPRVGHQPRRRLRARRGPDSQHDLPLQDLGDERHREQGIGRHLRHAAEPAPGGSDRLRRQLRQQVGDADRARHQRSRNGNQPRRQRAGGRGRRPERQARVRNGVQYRRRHSDRSRDKHGGRGNPRRQPPGRHRHQP